MGETEEERYEKRCIHCETTETSKWYAGPSCSKCYYKNRYLRHKERILASQDPQRKRDNAKTRYRRKRRELLADNKSYYQENRDRILKSRRQYYKENREIIVKKQVDREAKRVKTDVQFMLRKRIRTRLKVAMKGNYQKGIAIEFLGCSIEALRKHLESLFQYGMTWKNYGKQWEIDHVKPLASFDLNSEYHLQQACHYSNLQPLWKSDHYEKTRKERKLNA